MFFDHIFEDLDDEPEEPPKKRWTDASAVFNKYHEKKSERMRRPPERAVQDMINVFERKKRLEEMELMENNRAEIIDWLHGIEDVPDPSNIEGFLKKACDKKVKSPEIDSSKHAKWSELSEVIFFTAHNTFVEGYYARIDYNNELKNYVDTYVRNVRALWAADTQREKNRLDQLKLQSYKEAQKLRAAQERLAEVEAIEQAEQATPEILEYLKELGTTRIVQAKKCTKAEESMREKEAPEEKKSRMIAAIPHILGEARQDDSESGGIGTDSFTITDQTEDATDSTGLPMSKSIARAQEESSAALLEEGSRMIVASPQINEEENEPIGISIDDDDMNGELEDKEFRSESDESVEALDEAQQAYPELKKIDKKEPMQKQDEFLKFQEQMTLLTNLATKFELEADKAKARLEQAIEEKKNALLQTAAMSKTLKRARVRITVLEHKLKTKKKSQRTRAEFVRQATLQPMPPRHIQFGPRPTPDFLDIDKAEAATNSTSLPISESIARAQEVTIGQQRTLIKNMQAVAIEGGGEATAENGKGDHCGQGIKQKNEEQAAGNKPSMRFLQELAPEAYHTANPEAERQKQGSEQTNPNSKKRAMKAYYLWREDYCRKKKESCSPRQMLCFRKKLVKNLGKAWNGMNVDEKKQWFEKAEEELKKA